MKKVYVKLKCLEDDSYNELYIVKNKEEAKLRYVARHTLGGGTWYYVCDPLGYRELNYPCPDDMVFVVCSPDGTELFESSNGDGKAITRLQEMVKKEFEPFITENMKLTCNRSTALYAQAFTGELIDSYQKWLLTFKDPEKYGESAKDYDENWCYYLVEETETKKLGSFKYMGIKFDIEKKHYKHKICGAEWDEYFSGGELMATEFDSSVTGPMLPESLAVKHMNKALFDIYGMSNHRGSIYHIQKRKYYGTDTDVIYLYEMPLYKGSELLLDRDYNKKHIDEKIEKEKESHNFVVKVQDAKKMFPNTEIYEITNGGYARQVQ